MANVALQKPQSCIQFADDLVLILLAAVVIVEILTGDG